MGKREAEAHHLTSGQDHWYRNLKWWNDFINRNMILEEWKENFRMSESSFFIFIFNFHIAKITVFGYFWQAFFQFLKTPWQRTT